MNSRAGSPELNTHPPVYTVEEPIRERVVKRVDEEITSVQPKSNVISVESAPTEVVKTTNLNVTTVQLESNTDSMEPVQENATTSMGVSTATAQPKLGDAVLTRCPVINVTKECSQPAAVKSRELDVTYVTQTSYMVRSVRDL